MKNLEYYYREQECSDSFHGMGNVYNACTPENHPIIFHSVEDFKVGMSILAICTMIHTNVIIYAFQLMSNHLHLVISGSRNDIEDFFKYYRDRLCKYFKDRVDLDGFDLKLYPVEDLSYFRNAVVYVNRNGFIVNSNVTPFSYPWGTSAYFFQPMATKYALECGSPIGNQTIRSLIHSKSGDAFKDLPVIDGSVSPASFCAIQAAENTFRDAKQYFYLIARNIEAYSNIAKSIGESVFYNDNDLFAAAVRISREHFGTADLQTLPAGSKLDLARQLHLDYNAGDKQLQRLLKIEPDILKSLLG